MNVASGRAAVRGSLGSSAADSGLRRVALRLAAQSVGLLLVMIIVLEVVVYVTTQRALEGTLRSTLKDRAAVPTDTVRATFHLAPPPDFNQGEGGRTPEPRPGDNGTHGPGGPDTRNPFFNPSEASFVFVDRSLHVQLGGGVLGRTVLDKAGVQSALRTHTVQCCSTQTYDDQNYLVYTRPLSADGRIVGVIQTSISKQQYDRAMRSLLTILVAVALLGLFASGAISFVLVRRSLRPIQAAVQRQRDFVADAAHELRTPLAIQRTVGEVAMNTPSVDELQATVAQMLGENTHLTRLVEDLSLLARADTDAVQIDRAPVDLSSVVRDTTEEIGYLAESQGVRLDAAIDGNLRVVGDVTRLRQLLLILLDNALKHTPAGGAIQVRLERHGGTVRLESRDSGPGLDSKDLPRIFDRFYRADRARSGEGSGLGLSIAKWIAEAHGGRIEAANAQPHGALFTVTLPASRAEGAS